MSGHAPATPAASLELVEAAGWHSYQFLEEGAPADLLDQGPARPGLWKRVPGPAPGRARWCFDLPSKLVAAAGLGLDIDIDPSDPADAVSTDPRDVCRDWVLATARNEPPRGWRPPQQPEAEGWMPRAWRTVHVGPFVRQATLDVAGGRLAVTMPVVATSGELSAQRRAHLRVLLEDAQVRWRMARLRATPLTLAAGGAGQVIAEVDLTGAPSSWQPGLVACGLDAVRRVVSWVILSAGLLADARVACRAWDHDWSAGFRPAADPERSV
jgi:hypothetical protein